MQTMDKVSPRRFKKMAPKIMKELEMRRFEPYFCETKEDALDKLISLIPDGSSVSWGGSITLEEMGVAQRVHSGNYNVMDRDKTSSPEERMELMRQALLCDYYLTSVNAISEDGILVSMDGVGNRVASLVFGPKNVIVVVGMNKIVPTLKDARNRTKKYAAPLNVERLEIEDTICAKTGTCGDCKTASSVCSYLVEQRMCKPQGRIKVILVGEELGY